MAKNKEPSSKWYTKYNWTSLAKDFNSPFIRNYIWVHGLFQYEKELHLPNLIIGIKSEGGDIEYVGDLDSWKKTHSVMRERADKDSRYVERELLDKINDLGNSFNQWSEEHIFNKDLSQLEDADLTELYNQFVEKQALLYTYGSTLTILDFTEMAYVEGNLEKILKEKAPSDLHSEYYSVFTEPVHDSFAQVQEKHLLRLIEKYDSDNAWKEDVLVLSSSEIKEKHSQFWEGLKAHTEKHCWVYYVYQGPSFTVEDFFDFVKEHVRSGKSASATLEHLEKKRTEIDTKMETYIGKLEPNEFEEMILRLAGKMVWTKPRRKDYQSKSYYHFEKLQREIAKRTNTTLEIVRLLDPRLLERSLRNKEIDTGLTDAANKLHVVLVDDDGGVEILVGETAEAFCEGMDVPELKDTTVEVVKGSTAFRGNAKGPVKIINRPEEMEKMEEGDVLVSIATTPSIIPAMKKAAAFVTDEGGLTCHAAIVSREMETPCVVGTKVATQVLKDGMEVEVDADKGVVKILKK